MTVMRIYLLDQGVDQKDGYEEDYCLEGKSGDRAL